MDWPGLQTRRVKERLRPLLVLLRRHQSPPASAQRNSLLKLPYREERGNPDLPQAGIDQMIQTYAHWGNTSYERWYINEGAKASFSKMQYSEASWPLWPDQLHHTRPHRPISDSIGTRDCNSLHHWGGQSFKHPALKTLVPVMAALAPARLLTHLWYLKTAHWHKPKSNMKDHPYQTRK